MVRIKSKRRDYNPIIITLDTEEEANILYTLIEEFDNDEDLAVKCDVPETTVVDFFDSLASGIRVSK
jgi:hypothetical protein